MDGKIHCFDRRNKNIIELQFDLLGKMDYYILRFFEIRSRDLLAQSQWIGFLLVHSMQRVPC
jgi:hypothetical protein